ncbi:MAG: DUF3310 domain-containing protein [Sporolactobacillus sp.]
MINQDCSRAIAQATEKGFYCSNCKSYFIDFKSFESHRHPRKETDISAPSYYTDGGIETWDFIIDKELNFLEGNVVKYVVRWRKKNGVEDLKKARVYLDKLIEEAEKHE